MKKIRNLQELRMFCERKATLRETEETLVGMREYHAALYAADPAHPTLCTLQNSIEQLTASSEAMQKELVEAGETVKATISLIENEVIRTHALLHFYEGFTWKHIAAMARKGEDAIKRAVYRALQKVLI